MSKKKDKIEQDTLQRLGVKEAGGFWWTPVK